MPRLPVVCLLPRRRVTLLVLQPGQRLVHSAPPRQRPASTIAVAIALVVLFTAFFTPSGYVLSNMNQF
ncbi:cytochrome c oxidase subunit 8C, mitochondrial [Balaenoptera musculus]|uniref:Cytochrome c oxidase subunit 8 n=1 Tax=Balaenoptera musculus TaxID=9771 RepID=A0A8B8WT23_BALMU|nr:cytochrome c oxidase subunit 8C, mitochondrial [Balaenoptera musculus]